jgi:hypothetical protein
MDMGQMINDVLFGDSGLNRNDTEQDNSLDISHIFYMIISDNVCLATFLYIK